MEIPVGHKECETCHGAGMVEIYVTCKRCGGSGMRNGEICCGGTDTMCETCHGAGMVEIYVTCKRCGGSGSYECEKHQFELVCEDCHQDEREDNG
jgi:RecJ-like exonuclease